jgi:hypothetical protein
MADITKCTNILCPNATHCYRITAPASEWQSYSNFKYTLDIKGVICDRYIPVDRVTTTECDHSRRDCSHLDFRSMPKISKGDRDGLVLVRCNEYANSDVDRLRGAGRSS